MKLGILALATASALVLSGCGSSAEPTAETSEAPTPTETSEAPTPTETSEAPTPSPTPTKTTPPADGGTYSSLAGLQQAYVAAGGDCSDLNQANNVTLAAESGDCDEDTVLSTYISSDQIAELIQNNKALHEELDLESDAVWLVGQNWVINSSDAADIQEEMGGQLVSF